MFQWGQDRPDEIGSEQGVAGCFFEFSLTTLHDLNRAVVQQRERPRRSVTANQPAPCRCQGRSLRSRCGAKRSSLDRDLEGPGYQLDRQTGKLVGDAPTGIGHVSVQVDPPVIATKRAFGELDVARSQVGEAVLLADLVGRSVGDRGEGVDLPDLPLSPHPV
jgi:hypothetical protein